MYWRQIKEEVLKVNPRTKTLVCSSEFMARFAEEEIREAVDLLKTVFKDIHIQIIVYLRRQPDHFVSCFNQSARNDIGSTSELPDREKQDLFSSLNDKTYDYHVFLERWKNAFGKENVFPRIFDRKKMVGNDLIDDFCSAIGLDASKIVRIDPQNESIGQEAIEFMLEFRKYFPAQKRDDWPYIYRDWGKAFPARILQENYAGKCMVITRKQAEAVLDRYRESNTRVAEEWFDGEPLFSDDCSDFPETVSRNTLTVEKSVEIAAVLWKNLNDKFKRESKEQFSNEKRIQLNCIFNSLGKDRKVAIFGAGNLGSQWTKVLVSKGIGVDCFIDNDPAKQGDFVDNVPVLSLQNAIDLYGEKKEDGETGGRRVDILIANFDLERVQEMIDQLQDTPLKNTVLGVLSSDPAWVGFESDSADGSNTKVA